MGEGLAARLCGRGVFREAVDGVQNAPRLSARIEHVVEMDGADAKDPRGIRLCPTLAAQGISCSLHFGGSFLVCGVGHKRVNVRFALTEEINPTKSDRLQEEFQTFSDFSRRTDLLAARKGLNMSDLHGILGISKAMLFAYRSGKNRITSKVWLKLKIAEEEAGIGNAESRSFAESSANVKDPAVSETTSKVCEDVAVYRTRNDVQGRENPQEMTLAERVERLERALEGIQAALRNL